MDALLLRAAGAVSFATTLHVDAWSWQQTIGWCAFILGALELVSFLTMVVTARISRRPPILRRGRHLDSLGVKDRAFIAFNKFTTCLFTHHLAYYAWHSEHIAWDLSSASLPSLALPLLCCFVVYDATYTPFHKALHIRAVYPWIHKHHHKQHAPSRGNTDAVNVHPFEFVSGEWNHLLALHATTSLLHALFGMRTHVLAVVLFILCGGVAASLNHTRFDVRFPLFPAIYQVRYHDVHHGLNVNRNFCQYVPCWDWLWGWFLPYPETLKSRREGSSNQKKAQ